MKYLTHRRTALLEAWTTYIEQGADILLCGSDTIQTSIIQIWGSHVKVVDIYGQIVVPINITARDINPNLNIPIFANVTIDGISVLCETNIGEKQTDVNGKIITPIPNTNLTPEIAENVLATSANAVLDGVSVNDIKVNIYQVTDNEAGGETYNIVTDDYTVEDNTIIITMGGSYGSE